LPPLPNTDDLDVSPESESYDCVDEILSLFRANVLFRNFEINGPADRMLIYGTLFISECLGKVKPTMNAREAEKVSCICCERALAEPNLTQFHF
jgi:actin related protein 2/3 complex subunit 3